MLGGICLTAVPIRLRQSTAMCLMRHPKPTAFGAVGCVTSVLWALEHRKRLDEKKNAGLACRGGPRSPLLVSFRKK